MKDSQALINTPATESLIKFTCLFLPLHTANTITHRQAKLEIYFQYGSDRMTAKGPQGLRQLPPRGAIFTMALSFYKKNKHRVILLNLKNNQNISQQLPPY